MKDYALKHRSIRNRELSWRMAAEDIAYLISSTVYHIFAGRGAHVPTSWTKEAVLRRDRKGESRRRTVKLRNTSAPSVTYD
ncbi:MAG: hypothetical protein KDB27_32045 [Planctomycetales bacterium]|nr:hypothetical protein [Planctomycetales bacterium]